MMDRFTWARFRKRFPGVPAHATFAALHTAAADDGSIAAPLGRHVAFSADSRWLAVASHAEPDIHVFDVADRTGHLVIRRAHRQRITSIAFDPRTGLLGSAGHDGAVTLWNLEAKQAALVLARPDADIRGALCFQDTRVLIGDDLRLDLRHVGLLALDLETGETTPWLELDADIGAVQIQLDAVRGEWQVWLRDHCEVDPHALVCLDPRGNERLRRTLPDPATAVQCIGDARVIVASVADDDSIELYKLNLDTGERTPGPALELTGTYLTASPDGSRFAVAQGGRLTIHDSATLAVDRQLPLPAGEFAASIAWSPDGAWIACALPGRDALRLFAAREA